MRARCLHTTPCSALFKILGKKLQLQSFITIDVTSFSFTQNQKLRMYDQIHYGSESFRLWFYHFCVLSLNSNFHLKFHLFLILVIFFLFFLVLLLPLLFHVYSISSFSFPCFLLILCSKKWCIHCIYVLIYDFERNNLWSRGPDKKKIR